jgi:hypothetical protein
MSIVLGILFYTGVARGSTMILPAGVCIILLTGLELLLARRS